MNTTLLTPPQEGNPELAPREQETQAAIWALMFLLSEVSLVIRVLRDRLTERGALLPEDEELINTAASQIDSVSKAYQHVENGFREKFNRVLFAIRNPQAVEQAVREAQTQGAASPQQAATTRLFEDTGETPSPEQPPTRELLKDD